MKKMFFTAIALVAFMGTSVANNTKEVKKAQIKPLSSKCVNAINAYMAAGYEWYDAIGYSKDMCK